MEFVGSYGCSFLCSGFYDTLSRDIRSLLSDATGFSARNLRYKVKFYAMYGSILNLPQFAAKIDEEELFSVPWGHHRVILDACKGDEGKAISNFEYTLPSAQGDLAQEITKDPYNFDFLSIREDYNEKQLKDALMDNVISLLLELGRGFAFVGREYPLPIEGTSKEPIGISAYELSNLLPTAEEIEEELRDTDGKT